MNYTDTTIREYISPETSIIELFTDQLILSASTIIEDLIIEDIN